MYSLINFSSITFRLVPSFIACLQDIEQLKQYIEVYNGYINVWKKYMAIDEDMSLLLPDELFLLSKFDYKFESFY